MIVSIFEIVTAESVRVLTTLVSSTHLSHMRVNSTGHHASSVPNVTSGSVLFEFIAVELIMQHFVLFLSHRYTAKNSHYIVSFHPPQGRRLLLVLEEGWLFGLLIQLSQLCVILQ